MDASLVTDEALKRPKKKGVSGRLKTNKKEKAPTMEDAQGEPKDSDDNED